MAENGTPELTPAQLAAIQSLLTERNIRNAARACGTPERTLYRWLADETFKRELKAAEAEVMAGAIRKLTSVVGLSIDELYTLVRDRSKRNRLAAIRIAIAAWPALKTGVDFEQRLAALEGKRAKH